MNTNKLIKKRDQAEIKMDSAKSTHDWARWHYQYWSAINKLKAKEKK